MEIQKYNVIVYIMLVLKKHLRVTSFKWVQFSIARFTQSSLAKSVRRSASRQSWGDFHCNIRGPAKGLELFPCFFFSHAYGSSNYMYQIYMLSCVYHLQIICRLVELFHVVSILLYDSIGQFSFFFGVGSYYIIICIV